MTMKNLMSPLFEVDAEIMRVIHELVRLGHRSLIVGGAVRDALLKIEPKDIDIEVYQINYSTLESILSAFGKTNTVGKVFGIIKFKGHDGAHADFSIPRRENKKGVGHRGFDIEFSDLSDEEAAERRDFTWNAMAYDPVNMTIYDGYGGLKDLKNKIIRHTSDKFEEDPLRVFRAMQFQARTGFSIANETKEIMRTMIGEIAFLFKERISEEFMKWAIKGIHHDLIFNFIRDSGLDSMFPELMVLKETPQDKIFHPEGDVEVHSKLVMRRMSSICDREELTGDRKAVLTFSALLHDIAKPVTTKEEFKKGRLTITSPGHDSKGGLMAVEILTRFNIKDDIIIKVKNLISNHLAHINISKTPGNKGKLSATMKLAKRLYPASIEELLWLIEADIHGRMYESTETITYSENTKRLALLERLSRKIRVKEEPRRPMLMGRHLIELGLKPSVEFGIILHAAEMAQDNLEFDTLEDGKTWLSLYLMKSKGIYL